MAWLPRVLAFMLFLAGRTARRVFAIGLVASIAAFFGLAVLWTRLPTPFHGVNEATRFLPFLFMWTKCALTARRLHDVNLTGWLTLPGTAIIVIPLIIRFVLPPLDIAYNGMDPFLENPPQMIFAAMGIIAILGDLILCFVPGTKGANRFGPPPGRPATPADAVF